MSKRRPIGTPDGGAAAETRALAPADTPAGGTAQAKPNPPADEQISKTVQHTYSISDLASEFAITTRTIRFYESRGLIAPQRIGTARLYSKRDRARLILILRGRNLGFTVEDVGEYLALYDADPGQVAQTRLLLDKVTAAISDLEKKRADIGAALADLAEIAAHCERHLKEK